MCIQEKITSLVKQHIPDAKLSAESEGKLVYTLPLEQTNKFPGNVGEHYEMKYVNNVYNNNEILTTYIESLQWVRYLKHDAKKKTVIR